MTKSLVYNESYMEPVPRLQLGFEDAAVAMALPLGTLEQICRAGEGPKFFKVGRRRFTTVALIEEWQAAQINGAV